MTGRPTSSTDELVADYVRSTMRVALPPAFVDDVMRSVAATPQERRTWFSAFGPFAPAIAAVAATALMIAVGFVLLAPRNVGPPPEPTPTPAPTLTPEIGRVLTEPGDVIRMAALDGAGQFGTVTIRRGEEKGGYEDFVPFAFEDVFFVELYVTYEPNRSTSEEYGEWEFAYAVDLEGDGFVDEALRRGVGFLGLEEQPGYDSAPQPLLQGKRFGDEVLEGWLVLELPAAAADFDLYLVYGHGEWTDGIENMVPDASALLRLPADPVGITPFDPDSFPSPEGTPIPMPSFHVLPSPVPSAAATFEPSTDIEADALFQETQSCPNAGLGVRITFPGSWSTNEAYEDIPACSFFGPDQIDAELIYNGLGDFPPVSFFEIPSWTGGIEQPQFERLPVGDRVAWRITFTEDQQSTGTQYLIPLTDDPYGPLLRAIAGQPDGRAVLERMLLRLEFAE
ncbi:MAG: hypothetical protein H0U86_03880 [Chloroflexi bacterium]|nr:hypothetical protein [Chloroflexota bacterium]